MSPPMITAEHLRGLPGLGRGPRDVLLLRQPATVLQALRVRGIGRRTTRALLALGVLTDPDGAQRRARSLSEMLAE